MSKRLRVLVIDDSSFNRRTISDILSSHPDIEVVDTAADGEQGLKRATELHPDLITLDLEMPRMDGFTFLRLLMSQMPTPVIVVSSHNLKQEVFQALEFGALDFIAKPSHFFNADESPLRTELLDKALAVRNLEIIPLSKRAKTRADSMTTEVAPVVELAPRVQTLKRLVCIGASTGGPPALQALFKAMRSSVDTAFAVAQHMPERFTRAFAERLDRRAELTICEARNNQVVEPGHVYIAPGGMHLDLVRVEDGVRTALVPRAEADHYVPSIDRLFRSAAGAFGGAVLAVVLTGMGNDGAAGVRAVRAVGGRTLAESRETAIVYGMPKEAVDTGCVDAELPLDELINRIRAFAVNGTFANGGG